MKPVGVDPDPSSPIRGGSFGWLPVPGDKMRMAVFGGSGLHTIGIADDELMIVDQTDEVLEDLRDMLARHPDAKSLRTLEGCEHPLLVNAAGEEKAGLISVHGKDRFASAGLELQDDPPTRGQYLHPAVPAPTREAPRCWPARRNAARVVPQVLAERPPQTTRQPVISDSHEPEPPMTPPTRRWSAGDSDCSASRGRPSLRVRPADG